MTGAPVDTYGDEQRFERLKEVLGEESYSSLMERLKERLSYSPVILFMGKTGVGKSSTCNALFGADMFKVDDVAACTREIQVEDLELPDKSLTLVDVPGVGENQTYTQEYKNLYRTILAEGVKDKKGNARQPDAVVFIFKADDRALQTDLECFQEVLRDGLRRDQLPRVVLAINQADKIEPIRGEGGWDDDLNRPGTHQLENIDRKKSHIAKAFDVESNLVIDYSAGELYNLDKLLERIVHVLPADRIPLVVEKALRQETILQQEAKKKAKKHKRPHKERGATVVEVPTYIPVLVNERVIEQARGSLWDVTETVARVIGGPLAAAGVRAVREFGRDVMEVGRQFVADVSETFRGVKEKAKEFFGGLFGRNR